ncbi:YdeI/OmpD-associated family protein [Poseidonocella sp. HB161398]|uniref:YdeI/OmpD-associated family protein n=1 Tax=Poseidonocella sp. HB161398 TaxID=2320855 RepID=UPI00110954CE|nr:YdeI/OmpD-associated family protein [Poseidonocella sp. HB161398]
MAGTVDPRIEAFFAAEGQWQAELAALRELLLTRPLAEEFKWRAPCYTLGGGNVATLWGFRDRCVLSFFKGVLIDDPEGRLEAPGPHSRAVRMIAVTGTGEIAAREDELLSFLDAAIALERAGAKVVFEEEDGPEIPSELADALDGDAALAAAFAALTPGRQRGYILDISRAKRAATRRARIGKHAARILDGKGLHDR